MNVLYWNIHHGRGLDDQVDLKRIAKVIIDSGADIAILSEVDNGRTRSGRVNQAEELRKLTDFSDALFYTSVNFIADGHYGNAIISRFPLVETSGERLPKPDGGEQRSVVRAVADLGQGRKIALYGTHLSIVTDERPYQINSILEMAAEESSPVIFAGDLNAHPHQIEVQTLNNNCFVDTHELINSSQPGLTFPAGREQHRIDYIFVEDRLKPFVANSSVIKTDASDHYAVLVQFVYPDLY